MCNAKSDPTRLFEATAMSSHARTSRAVNDFAERFAVMVRELVPAQWRTPRIKAFRELGVEHLVFDWAGIAITLIISGSTKLPGKLSAGMEIHVADATDALQLIRLMTEKVQGREGATVLIKEDDYRDAWEDHDE